jgi:hypothetical protein
MVLPRNRSKERIMGIRLYPNTKNPVALERIVGVPAGTAARLAEMEKRHAEEREGNTDPELGYRQYCEKDGAIGEFDTFLTFGWGKFFDPLGVAPGYSGSLSDPEKIASLFGANGITPTTELDEYIALCEGVHWC